MSKKIHVVRMISIVSMIGISITGCGVIKESSKAESALTTESAAAVHITPAKEIEKQELNILEDEPMSFSVGEKIIKVKDEENLANAVMDVQWIDDVSVAVVSHVNPSMSYFTVYDTSTDQFTFSTYGYGFVWKDKNIKTLRYVSAPPHFTREGDYSIMDYDGNILYSTSAELSNLIYNGNGKLTFEIAKEDGTVEEKELD